MQVYFWYFQYELLMCMYTPDLLLLFFLFAAIIDSFLQQFGTDTELPFMCAFQEIELPVVHYLCFMCEVEICWDS